MCLSEYAHIHTTIADFGAFPAKWQIILSMFGLFFVCLFVGFHQKYLNTIQTQITRLIALLMRMKSGENESVCMCKI